MVWVLKSHKVLGVRSAENAGKRKEKFQIAFIRRANEVARRASSRLVRIAERTGYGERAKFWSSHCFNSPGE